MENIEISLDEIARRFVEMERVAYAFFSEANKRVPSCSDLFIKIAKEEEKHVVILEDFAVQFVKQHKANKNYVIPAYMKTILESKLLASGTEMKRFSFDDGCGAIDILEFACDREEDAILFYVGLKDVVEDNSLKIIIEDVIKEEMNHIAWLKEQQKILEV